MRKLKHNRFEWIAKVIELKIIEQDLNPGSLAAESKFLTTMLYSYVYASMQNCCPRYSEEHKND